MENFKTQLGPFFRHIRVRRGLKIRDVSINIAETTLSRFERGQIDLTVDKLIKPIEAAEIDITDLLLESSGSRLQYEQAMARVFHAIITQDSEAAVKATDTYLANTHATDLPLRYLNTITLRTLTQFINDPEAYMDLDDQQEVIRFLDRDDDWHHFEYTLLGAMIYFMEDNAAERCLNIMVRSFVQRDHPLDDCAAFNRAMAGAMIRPLAEHNIPAVTNIAERLRAVTINPADINFSYMRALLLRTAEYENMPNAVHLAKISQIIDSLRIIGRTELADGIRHNFNRLLNISIPA